jgi:transposase
MIPRGVEVFVALEPVDMRWSFDRLGGAVIERFGREARSGALFVFFGKRRSALKVFFADNTGFCIFYKRLHKNVFRLPMALDEHATTVLIEESALDDLLDGIDVESARSLRRAYVPIH